MCTGTSTIVYGIVIKTWTLLVAAFAFQKIKPILLALDLVLLRKKTGTFVINDIIAREKNIGGLPVEIIGMIRDQVIMEISMKKEASQYIKTMSCGDRDTRCDSCGWFHEADRHYPPRIGSKWTTFIRGRCGECQYPNSSIRASSNLTTNLLENYGLENSTAQIIDADDDYDLNKFFSVVSIPVPSSSVQSRVNHVTYQCSAIPLYFDTATIDTTTVQSRFKRLVTDWELELYDKSVQEMRIGREDVIKGGEDMKKGKLDENGKKEKNDEKVKIEPRWMVWNECSSCH